jgi:rhodanese-related sulfurtransferase
MDHSAEFLAIVADAKSRIEEIDVQQYQAMRESGQPHLLIDVREESEFASGHAKDALHLGKGVIERDIVARVPEKATTLVLYCGGGYRSALAADNLRKMGYQKVLSLAGGWRAWKDAGLPTE